jgi:hypothetical protein
MTSYLVTLGAMMLGLFLAGCLAGALAWRAYGGKIPPPGGQEG